MPDKTDELRNIFLDVSDDGTVTERQDEGASKAPVGERDAAVAAEAAESAREDGLDDAVDGVDTGTANG